jgi:hypothetical protein
MRGTVDAEPMPPRSAGQGDLPAARKGDQRGFGVGIARGLHTDLLGRASTIVRNRAVDFLRLPFQGDPRP